MDNETREQMNVAKPTLVFKGCAWVGFLAFWCFEYYVTTRVHETLGKAMSQGVWVFLPVIGFFLYGIVRAHEVYRWNDEEIRLRVLGRERSMRWNEITRVHVRRFDGSPVLIDAEGRRLIFHMIMLGEDPPLQCVLIEKLAYLDEQELANLEGHVKQIEAAGEARFALGWGEGHFTLFPDSLTHQVGRKTRTVVLSEVEAVYQRGLKGCGGTNLVTRSGETFEISPATRDYATLIACLKTRTEDAVWVNLDGPEPASSQERTAYLRQTIAIAARFSKPLDLALGLCFMAAILVGFAIWFVARSASPVWVVVPVVLLFPGCFVIPCAVFAAHRFRDNARKLKELQKRLAALGDDELARGVKEEDGE
jgi:hypothetical protein